MREEGRALALGPLDGEAVRQMALLYASEGDVPPVDQILESTRGLPGRMHRALAEWAREAATRRLAHAAQRAATDWSDLREREADLARNVIDLQLARDRFRAFDVSGYGEADGESPFKGLAAFDVGDAEMFFGRERLVADLIARLAGASFLGVVGPSGSGKSSAVRAGLVPALAAGVLPGAGGGSVSVRPGEHPLRELDRTLWSTARRPPGPDGRPGPSPARRPWRPRRRRTPLLVVDQFEEVFTAVQDEAGALRSSPP